MEEEEEKQLPNIDKPQTNIDDWNFDDVEVSYGNQESQSDFGAGQYESEL